MTRISVKTCCLSPKAKPQFFAEQGSNVLVKTSTGLLQEVRIVEIDGGSVVCEDSLGNQVALAAEQIQAVCIP